MDDMSVHRLRPLQVRRARGCLVVPTSVLDATQAALKRFRGAAGDRHEGLVFWAGRVVDGNSYVLTSVLPNCDHGPYRVFADERAMGAVARAARREQLGIVAEVHSHPGDDTRHSDGDDDMIFMPFEGMFSLVVARYGDGSMLPDGGAGLHQFQDGLWVKVAPGQLVLRPLFPTVEVAE
jgi:proteasome lid subunit RPN8/RPN11